MALRPLFEEIKDFIKKQIEDGVYKEGDKIPTEMELAKTFQTSRQTVNKALRDLVLDDIIERFPRSGSFVKTTIAQTSILDLKDIATEIVERGNSYTNKLVSLTEIRANEKISKILNVVKDQKIYISQMIHYENGVPVRFDTRYIKPSSCKEYIKQTFTQITPSQYLQKNCPVEKVDNTIEAILVEEDIQEYLDISRNEPCLRISRLVTSKGEIASYSKLYYPSSRYKLNSTFVGA
ncbi:GntR family transcriptional regulator [Sulfurospirillum arcachonense]|uniref:GntR family transcriptional regulator n=1 Tax=Sulfurospirillum arcachonense TaxID=57666 RepID=UPI00046893CA|nr:GntR family transcriptional regulator [Sulfurospirillum arcachonense]